MVLYDLFAMNFQFSSILSPEVLFFVRLRPSFPDPRDTSSQGESMLHRGGGCLFYAEPLSAIVFLLNHRRKNCERDTCACQA